VLVCVSEPTFPGCAVLANPIGLFNMEDEKGPDDHVVCVPCDDPGWNRLGGVADLPVQLRAEIGHFFSVYKDLDPARHSKVNGWADRGAAIAIIDEARSRFRRQRAVAPERS
jgi:inorganic pyrophosphatase